MVWPAGKSTAVGIGAGSRPSTLPSRALTVVKVSGPMAVGLPVVSARALVSIGPSLVMVMSVA